MESGSWFGGVTASATSASVAFWPFHSAQSDSHTVASTVAEPTSVKVQLLSLSMLLSAFCSATSAHAPSVGYQSFLLSRSGAEEIASNSMPQRSHQVQ